MWFKIENIENYQSIVIRKTSFARNFSLSFLIFTMFYVTVIIPIRGIGSVAPRPIRIIIRITAVIMVWVRRSELGLMWTVFIPLKLFILKYIFLRLKIYKIINFFLNQYEKFIYCLLKNSLFMALLSVLQIVTKNC